MERTKYLANRYRVLRLIGKGGTSEVYEVFDEMQHRAVALKRLLPALADKEASALLFRREFHTLAQLNHPLIIRVFDYGTDEGVPYYTMEVVEGENLRALAPMKWREAAALLRDVASALALVHSRRLVHRDVTPRNVCRTKEGRAKLLDFGSLSPMGVAYELAGTPPFVAPESLDGQPLNARSDLFSLGALAYDLLTGKHAYPAAHLSELRALWSGSIAAPSDIIDDIPKSFDSLVLSLLSLNPLARPVNAAEVFDRLTAIADLPTAETPDIAQSYLLTPTVVGRSDAILRFRRRLLRAERRRGSTLLIEGKNGFGRSRLLTSFLIEAKLHGMLALYAEGEEGRRGPFAVVRVLARRLAETEPALARELDSAPLDRLDVRGDSPAAGEMVDRDAWPHLIDALTLWFIGVGSQVSLVIGVDDIENTDAPSVAVLSKIAEVARSRPLLVLGTAELGSTATAVERFRRSGSSLVLRPLRLSDTRTLLSSVFGDVSHIDSVTEWVHRIAEGSPRTTLELAQHLVDHGIARYQHGSWVLPESLDALDLPGSVDQALDAKIASLQPLARTLSEALAFTAEHEPLMLAEYPIILGEDDPGRVFEALDQLVAAGILVQSEFTYVFPHLSIKEALRRATPVERRAELQRRLAHAYSAGRTEANLLTAHHLFLAGEEAEAFSTLIRFISQSSRRGVRGKSFMRSAEGAHFYDKMFEWASCHEVPAQQLLLLGRSVLQLASISDTTLAKHAPVILERLQKDAGLVYWDEFESAADPLEHLRLCMARATAERQNTPESERGLEPMRAIHELGVCCAMLSGVFARSHDAEKAVALTELMDRLLPLAPAVEVVASVVGYTANALRGWSSRHLRLRVIELLQEPIAGIDEASRIGTRLITYYYQALEDATLGQDTAFERLAVLDGRAAYVPVVWQVRMIAHLFQGAEKQADNCRRKRDVALASRPDVDRHLETSIAFECQAYIVLGDLMRLKHMLPQLKARAEKWPGWRPHYLVANGAYLSFRGDFEKAREQYEQALELAKPGAHRLWFTAASRMPRVLLQLQRASDAHDFATMALAQAVTFPAVVECVDQLEMVLALCEAKVGLGDVALRRSAEVVERAERRGTRGIMLVELHATRAEIAQALSDRATFEIASHRVKALCGRVESAAFATKLSSLMNLSIAAGFEPVRPRAVAFMGVEAGSANLASKVRTELELCQGAGERANRALGVLLEHSTLLKGFLYLNRADGLTLAASRSNLPPPVQMEEYLLTWLRHHGKDEDNLTTASVQTAGPTELMQAFMFVPIVAEDGGSTALAAVVALDCRGGSPRPIPQQVLLAVGQSLLDAGDVAAL